MNNQCTWVIFYICDIVFIYIKLILFIVECETILNALKILFGEDFFFFENSEKKLKVQDHFIVDFPTLICLLKAVFW